MEGAAHLFIVTGASRGMGVEIARQLLEPGHRLLCISRRENAALAQQATSRGVRCEQWSLDLGEPQAAAQRLRTWLANFDPEHVASATLINNAAALAQVVPLSAADAADVAQALRVGLEAPMLLTAAFLGATQAWTAPRRVLNVSSGLGRRAMASQAPYCAAKAGIDHFSRAVALDEAKAPNGARIVALAPGVIDTDMQTQLREANAAAFPDRASFIGLKDGGQLASAADAARRVLDYLRRPDFGSQPVADVRDA